MNKLYHSLFDTLQLIRTDGARVRQNINFTTLQRDNGDAIVESTPKFFLGHIKVLHLLGSCRLRTYSIRFAVNHPGGSPTQSSLLAKSMSAEVLEKCRQQRLQIVPVKCGITVWT